MHALTLCVALAFTAGADPINDKEYKEVITKGIEYLKKQQEEDGSFSPKAAGPGITALVVAALLKNGVSANDPVVAKAIKYLESNVQKDGSFTDQRLSNYVTSVCVLALHDVNEKGKYDKILKDAAAFLKTVQNQGESSEAKFGGAGYQKQTRPDLSNTQFFLEALLSAGLKKDDPAVRDALIFVSRCQNLPSEFNKLEFAKKVSKEDKGGFVYTPVPGRNAKEGDALKTQGAMTYAGLKCLLYAGVSKDDPRVKEAVGWIRANYTLEKPPGRKTTEGLYYYYHVLAKALEAYGEDAIKDKDGKSHNWRADLFNTLKEKQRKDGSWVNEDTKHREGDPNLCTAFALLSLQRCQPAVKETRK